MQRVGALASEAMLKTFGEVILDFPEHVAFVHFIHFTVAGAYSI
jgi:hypothetical protein